MRVSVVNPLIIKGLSHMRLIRAKIYKKDAVISVTFLT
jgi:hypothetical protein